MINGSVAKKRPDESEDKCLVDSVYQSVGDYYAIIKQECACLVIARWLRNRKHCHSPWTVMVHLEDTFITEGTVMRSIGLDEVTFVADTIRAKIVTTEYLKLALSTDRIDYLSTGILT